MFKRYLLAVSDMAFISGLMVVLLPCVVLGVVTICAGLSPKLSTTLLFVGLPGGIVLGGIQSYFRHTHISHADDYREERLGRVRLLKVDERGKVTDFGNRLWGRVRVHSVGLPFAWRGEFSTPTHISQQVGDVEVSARITLTAYVPREGESMVKGVFDYGFIPQELYDVVVTAGYNNVERWLAESFKEAAEGTPTVQQVFETHGKLKDPFALTRALTEALKTVPFSPKLTNISSIDATVVVDSASFTTKVTYS